MPPPPLPYSPSHPSLPGGVLLLLLGVLPLACTADHWPDYRPLERQLAVVWVAAELRDEVVLDTYSERALRHWRSLRKQAGPLAPAERLALHQLDLWLLGLRNAVAARQYPQVLAQLQRLRYQLGELRKQQGGDDPLDELYGFAREWQWVMEISEDQMMCLLDWPEYVDAYASARQRWTRFQRSAPLRAERTLPGLHRRAAAAERAGVALSAALTAFEEQLARADHAPMAEAGRRVHEHFIAYLRVAVEYPTSGAGLTNF